MKLFGLLMVFAGCTFMGFLRDYHKKQHMKELENMIFAFELLKSEIDYGLTPLDEACKNVARSSLPQVGSLFGYFAEAIEKREAVDLGLVWRQGIMANRQALHLEDKVYPLIEPFGVAAGYLDKEMQKKNIDRVLESLRHLYEGERVHYEKSSKFNTTMGMLAGASVAILLL
ncbi:MAG: hypothetical protein ACRCW2_09735 [Cellulosilyticaceae bacterium]